VFAESAMDVTSTGVIDAERTVEFSSVSVTYIILIKVTWKWPYLMCSNH
jgi:hypothetical protein